MLVKSGATCSMAPADDRRLYLRRLHPDAEITWIDKGQANYIAKIGDEFIYKFPIKKEWFCLLRKEYNIYKLLAGRVSIDIPVALELNDAEQYLKLNMIKGNTISSQDAHRLNSQQKKSFASKIATFIKEINSPDLRDGFDSIFKDDKNDYYYIENWLERVAEQSKSIDTDLSRKYLEQYHTFREVLEYGFSVDNFIAHKDLHEDNLIFNEQKELVGIIDFAELRYTSIHSELRTLIRFGIDTVADIIEQIDDLAKGVTVSDILTFAKTYEIAIIVQNAYIKKELPWRVEQAKFFTELWDRQ